MYFEENARSVGYFGRVLKGLSEEAENFVQFLTWFIQISPNGQGKGLKTFKITQKPCVKL